MLILPAIDLRGGKCVRLAQGDYAREKVYFDDAAEVAAGFESKGAKWLHVVDLDGAKTGIPENIEQVKRIVAQTQLKVEVGGGVRSLETAQRLLDAGVTRVVLGTQLIKEPEWAKEVFRTLGDKVVAGIDAREGKVAVQGWLQTSEVTATELAVGMVNAGARRIILTDIARDGMLTGPNLQLLADVVSATKAPIIQSGGISSLQDLIDLKALGVNAPEGVIVGRAIYEGRFTVAEALASIA